jgi:HK97 gp10 family phage protein
MANEFAIHVKGIEAVCANLDKMPDRLVKGAYAKALSAAAVPIVEALVPRIPVHTGDLAAHLVTEVAINAEGKGGYVQIGFGKRSYIARFLEYGHRKVGHKPKLTFKGQFVSARPFMRPATETAAEAAVQAFANSINESVETGI